MGGLRGSVCVAACLIARASFAASDFDEIDAFVEHEMERHGAPGLALAIVKDGRLVHARGFGATRPGGDPVTPRTPFILGSMSKSFTALAVMQLAEARRVDLEAPVETYLPWFAVGGSQARAITLEHLLHHTSGIPPTAHGPERDGGTLEDQVRALRRFEVVAAPGERHLYSSMNYLVLGLVVEEVSGETFAGYVERHIFEPLGMTSSFTSIDRARAGGLSEGHRLWFGSARPADLRHEDDRLPTAGLISSAEDLATYFTALMGVHQDAEKVVTSTVRAELEKPGAPAPTFSYGLGWRNGTTAGVRSLWHGGALSHYRGALVISPSERWGVVVLSNLGSHFGDHTRAIASGVTARLFDRPRPEEIRSLALISRLAAIPLAIWLVSALWNLARLGRWWSRTAPTLEDPRTRRRSLLRNAGGLLWPIVLVLSVSLAMGLPIRAIVEAVPDLSLGFAAIAALEVALAAIRLRMISRARSGPDT